MTKFEDQNDINDIRLIVKYFKWILMNKSREEDILLELCMVASLQISKLKTRYE